MPSKYIWKRKYASVTLSEKAPYSLTTKIGFNGWVNKNLECVGKAVRGIRTDYKRYCTLTVTAFHPIEPDQQPPLQMSKSIQYPHLLPVTNSNFLVW